MKSVLSLHPYTAQELAEITGGELHCYGCTGAVKFFSIVTDSREAGEGSLFLALPGERTDGHAYIPAAVESGAVCVLASRLPEQSPAQCAVVVVEDVIKALGMLAQKYARENRDSIRTVAVTGSVGKTTTKEFIAAVLDQKYKLHKSTENHNNEIGLPMTLLATPGGAQASVLEMGMSGFGEIDYLSRMAQPDIAVITTIGSSHLEQLGSRENICRAKLEIVHGLSEKGMLLCNGDEPLLFHEELEGRRPVFVAIRNRRADFRAVNIRQSAGKTIFDLIYQSRAVTNVELPTMGIHNIYAALFAYAIGVASGMNDNDIRRGLMQFKNADMRQNVYDIGGVTVIEDCYNASPESMRAALDVLCELSRQRGGTRKLALLGDMRELGSDSVLMHNQLGIAVAQRRLNGLFTLGGIAEEIAFGAIQNGMRAADVYPNPNLERPDYSGEMLLRVLKPGDILLVKASRAIRAERVTAYLRANAGRIGESIQPGK